MDLPPPTPTFTVENLTIDSQQVADFTPAQSFILYGQNGCAITISLATGDVTMKDCKDTRAASKQFWTVVSQVFKEARQAICEGK